MYCAVSTVHPITLQMLTMDEMMKYEVGLTVDEVGTIWAMSKDAIVQHYLDNHHYEPAIYPYESVVATLYWLRRYPPERVLAAQFSTTEYTVRELIQHTLQVLLDIFVPHYLDIHNTPTSCNRVMTGQHCYGALDTTFVCIHEPEQKAERGTYYHIKAGTSYALKFQLAVHMNGYIWDVSNVVEGSASDITLYRHSGIFPQLHNNRKLLGDKGYQGGGNLITPMKKPPNRVLTRRERDINNNISSHRAIVENAIHVLKGWSIIGYVYRQDRHDLASASRIVRIIAALYNLRFARTKLRAE